METRPYSPLSAGDLPIGSRWYEVVKDCYLPDLEIPGYFSRWVLGQGRNDMGQTKATYLHYFEGPDEPVFHDHPWPFTTIILAGGYRERQRLSDNDHYRIEWREAGQMGHKGPRSAHYIESVQPGTWTLVETGYRCRDWGFYLPDNSWVSHTEYKAKRQPIYRGAYAEGPARA